MDSFVCNCMMLVEREEGHTSKQKVRAILDLVRMDLVFGAGIFVVAGEIFGAG